MTLAAVALLIVNDHYLKRAFPGFVTGKLSDVAGLAFFPLLLQAIYETFEATRRRAWQPSRRVLLVSIAATAVAFTIAKTTVWGADAYRSGLGLLQWPIAAVKSFAVGRGLPPPRSVAFTRDPSDLVALPALLIAFVVGSRRVRRDG